MEYEQLILFNQLKFMPAEHTVTGETRSVRLAPKVSQLLELLLQNNGAVVTRDEILDKVWPNRFGADQILSKVVSELRKALLQIEPTAKDWLTTIPKKGYKLSVTIQKYMPLESRSKRFSFHSRKRLYFTLTFLSVLVVSSTILVFVIFATPTNNELPKSIAVLVVKNLSGDERLDDVALGLTEEILHVIDNQTDIRVIARTTSEYFSNKGSSIKEIAAALDVTHLLEGSIRKNGDNLRVTVQLIETHSESHLWSKNLEFIDKDLFYIQDHVAQQVSEALQIATKPPVSKCN